MGATNHVDRIYAQQPSCAAISSVASKPVSLLLDAVKHLDDRRLSSPHLPSTRHAFSAGQLLRPAASCSLRMDMWHSALLAR